MAKDNKLSIEQKIEIIQSAEKIGLRQTEKLYGVTKKTIIGWKKKFYTGGETALQNASRENQQHPARISNEIRAKILNSVAENPRISAKQIIKNLDLDCSITTVLKIIKHGNQVSVTESTTPTWYLNAVKTPLSAAGKSIYLLTAIEKESGIVLPGIAFENIPIYLNKFVKYICGFLQTASRLQNIEIKTINGRFRSGNTVCPVESRIVEQFNQIIFKSGEENNFHSTTLRNFTKSIPATNSGLQELFTTLNALTFQNNLKAVIKKGDEEKMALLAFRPVNINLDFYDSAARIIEKPVDTAEILNQILTVISTIITEFELDHAKLIIDFLANNSSIITGLTQKVKLLQVQGDYYLKKYQYPQAKEKYLSAASMVKESSNIDLQLSVAYDLGLYYFRSCRFKLSENILTSAIKKAQAGNFKYHEAMLSGELGRLYRVHNNPLTLAVHERQLEIAMEIDNRDLYCSALTKLSGYYLKNGESTKSLKSAEKCLILAKKSNYTVHIINSLSNIGECYLFTQQFEQAEHFFEEARQVAVEKSIKPAIADVTAYLGYAQVRQNKLQSGISNMDKALAQARQLGDVYREQFIFAMIGQAYQTLSNFKKAVLYYQKAINIDLVIENTEHLSTVYGNLITCYNELGQYANALKFANLKYEFAKSSKSRYQTAIAVGKIGACALNLGDYALALSSYLKQLKLLKTSDAESSRAFALSNIGHIYFETGDYGKAVTYYKKAEQIFAALNNQRYLARIYFKLAECYKNSGKLKDLNKNAVLSREKAILVKDHDILDQIDELMADN